MSAGANQSGAAVFGVPGRYAKAFFELGRENGSLEALENELRVIQQTLHASDDLQRLVKSPLFSREDQLAGLDAVFGKAGFSETTANFLGLITTNRRLFALDQIITTFFAILSTQRGEISAEVISATALDGGQIKNVKDAIKSAVGQDVQLEMRVDPAIIGGLIIKVGSRMIDNSIKTKLNNLKIAMKDVG